MKIAVTSTGEALDSQVDPRFGRASCFIIVETETMEHSVVENTSIATAGGAGISSAKAVADTGAEAVLTGNCGPNAQRTLDAAGIRLYTDVTGTVAEAVERFKSGALTVANGPNVQTHFGMGK
ncbi:MAG: NifB/NifX family molybdenum-iron cluster-binding protein [Sedimentisphaerales bacterium]|jgi:predicted Fe-Mo cluster-binding NifX family protein